MYKSIVKFLVFIIILISIKVLISIIIVIKYPHLNLYRSNINAQSDSSFYFLGSSRVQYSLNPIIIKQLNSNKTVYNLGIRNSNFYVNLLLCNYLLKEHSPKAIFVELSLLKNNIPPGVKTFSRHSNFNLLNNIMDLNGENNYIDHSIILTQYLYQNLFDFISLRNDIKQLFSDSLIISDSDLVGYRGINENNYYSTKSFINFNNSTKNSETELQLLQYILYIQRIINLAKKKNCKVVFFLPLTSKNPEEVKIIMLLFEKIEPTNKLIFSDSFLQSIRKIDYLYDDNHFNSFGANVYSLYMSEYLNKNF